jgi:hypothetical protein
MFPGVMILFDSYLNQRLLTLSIQQTYRVKYGKEVLILILILLFYLLVNFLCILIKSQLKGDKNLTTFLMFIHEREENREIYIERDRE